MKKIYAVIITIFLVASPLHTKIKAIIFDMDGTTTNSEPAREEAVLLFLQENDIVPNLEELKIISKILHGASVTVISHALKKYFDMPQNVNYIEEELKRLFNDHIDKIVFIPRFKVFHEHCKKRGIRTALASNSNREFVLAIDQHLHLSSFFGPHLYTIADVGNRPKPDPSVFLYAAQQLGVAPEECIIIEDSAVGIQAAYNAGIKCIGINTCKHAEKLQKATMIVESYDDIDLDNLDNV